MAYYLSMDGVDDRIIAPRVAVDRIVMDITVDFSGANATPYLFDNRGGTPAGNYMVYAQKASTTLSKGSGITTLKIDGVDVGAGKVIVSGQRYTVEALFTSVTPDANGLEFFINYALQAASVLKGRIYGITAYNSGVAQYSYNMTLGNVQDQSGNNNHATLTGGTWVQEVIATVNNTNRFLLGLKGFFN